MEKPPKITISLLSYAWLGFVWKLWTRTNNVNTLEWNAAYKQTPEWWLAAPKRKICMWAKWKSNINLNVNWKVEYLSRIFSSIFSKRVNWVRRRNWWFMGYSSDQLSCNYELVCLVESITWPWSGKYESITNHFGCVAHRSVGLVE